MPEEFINIDNVCNIIEIMSSQVSYEKYDYIYQLLKCELKLLLMDEKDSKIIDSIKEKLLNIYKATYEGNKTISDRADEILKEYSYILERNN